ncbi:MAG: glycerophosphodiester phosphodiesterase [Verrucomicrobiales bacterium]
MNPRQPLKCLLTLLPFAFAMTTHADSADQPLVVAHRGASHDAPENTLAAFRLAWEQGADAIEGDFFLTRDGKIVCTHDRVTGRLNSEKLRLEVAKSTLAELQALDVGSWKGLEWEGERMPTLAEVLATVPDGKRVLIELKCGPEILGALKGEIEKCSLQPGQITIISFKKAVVAGAKETLPEIKAYWLAAFESDKESGELTPTQASVFQTLRQVRADGFSCRDHESLDSDFLVALREMGCEAHCWTIDDPQRARELAEMGMQSITTNRPAPVGKALREVRR